MTTKNRKQGQRLRKLALVAAASATATCLTVGAAAPAPPTHRAVSTAPVALAAATGPDYTALITSLSNSTNNVLFAQGNFQAALATLLQPLLAATGGTAGAGTQQLNLATVTGILQALGSITVPDLSGVPGLPADATAQITNALLPGLGVAGIGLAPVLNLLANLTILNTLTSAISGLNADPAITALLATLNLTGITLPGLDDLIPGLTASLTQYQSNYDLPLFGLGTLLGLSGQTNVSNIFAQVPSLTVPSLLAGILGGLQVGSPAGPIALPPVLATAVGGVLTPVLSGLISTPSVTAWIPLASGNYGLPLGGSVGFLSTVPTLDLGSLTVLGVPVPGSDTVISIPINAAGAKLPLGLGSLGIVNTPGVLFPTATGVNTVGGLSLTSLNLLGFGLTNVNAQLANYYGINGIDYSSGQNVLLITTPFGPVPVPIVYSLGAINAGDSGFGFSGPSLFGVGILPPLQVGSAPQQQSDDGLIPASILNLLHTTLRAGVPTQATSVTQLLGIPDVGAALSGAVLTPGFDLLLRPVGMQFTNGTNQINGPLTNGLAISLEQLTAAIARLSYALPGANTPVVPAPGVQPQVAPAPTVQSRVASSNVVPGTTTAAEKKPVVESIEASEDTSDAEDIEDTEAPSKNVQNELRNANTQIASSVAAANGRTTAAVAKARADIEKSVKAASDNLNKIAKDGGAQIKKVVDGVQKAVTGGGSTTTKSGTGSSDKKDAKAGSAGE